MVIGICRHLRAERTPGALHDSAAVLTSALVLAVAYVCARVLRTLMLDLDR